MEKTDSGESGGGRGPQSWQILSGTGIKIIGVILMTMDHVHQMFIAQGAPAWLGWFGRPVATMFLFLGAEGFYYTRNKIRYLLQLLGCFLFMSAMNLILSFAMPMEDINLINNIFGTLFLAAFFMWMVERLREGLRAKKPALVLSALGGFLLPLALSAAVIPAMQSGNRILTTVLLFIPNPLTVEGGFVLVLMGLFFYLFRKYRPLQAAMVLAVGAVSLYGALSNPGTGDYQWLMVFALIPLFLYNGKRGRGGKYFFYVYYPAHVYLFYCAAWLLRSLAAP